MKRPNDLNFCIFYSIYFSKMRENRGEVSKIIKIQSVECLSLNQPMLDCENWCLARVTMIR